MPQFEYKVVPAPKRAKRVKGVKTQEGRFAHALTDLMNGLGADGWEYVRADTLPCEERGAFGGRSVHDQNMLVFRRAIEPVASAEAITSAHLAQSERQPVLHPMQRWSEPEPEPQPEREPEAAAPQPPEPAPASQTGPEVETVRTAFRMNRDAHPNGQADQPMTLPPLRNRVGEPSEPVFSHSAEGRPPPLRGVRHRDER
ncbi:MAG: DUF4177 domain-containing protein [Pseudomonadota bacterium]